jgi:ABC-type Fe3+-hydroxamate transport system substrate-binding protein
VEVFRDQMGFTVESKIPPQRIISLVPSQTELLFDLGLADQLVGVTKFCVHPEAAKTKSKIGGTKKFDFDSIEKLKPDLIIGNKEENYEEGINKLREKYPVWMSDIFSLEDAYSMMLELGRVTNTQQKSIVLVDRIKQNFSSNKKFLPLRVLYLIWKQPWMAAGKNTFIDSLITKLGLVNAIDEARYPELSNEKIMLTAPDVIFLSSEPYPFREKHISELRSLVPNSKVVLTDGEFFSWYGSRLLKAPDYFESLRIQIT